MVVEIDKDIATIDNKLKDLEIHARECSQEVIDDTLVIGKFMGKLVEKDLSRLYSSTGKFYNECICTKKSLFERK